VSVQARQEKALPSPEEYLKRNPMPGGMLYYPGSGLDYGPMKLFYELGKARRFIHADYMAERAEAEQTTRWLWERYERRVTELEPKKFRAREWADLWHPGARGKRPQVVPRSYGFQQEIRTGAGKDHVDFYFLWVDAIGAWKHLVMAGYKPDVVVLQDHGFGGNWGHFGGERDLYREVQKAGHWPEYLLVAKNTRPWPGYRAVSRAAYQKGQMHSHDRAIYRRDGSEEWPYIPGETGWLGGWGG
jgi:hypothetical protein